MNIRNMDQLLREQIRLILDDATDGARKAATERLQAVFVDRNRRGLLHSSVTVGGAIVSLEEDGSRYVVDCVERVAVIDKSTEAFAMLSEANDLFITFLTAKYNESVRKGFGGRSEQSRAPNFNVQYAKMWRDACRRIRRQLELHRFAFTKPSSPIQSVPNVETGSTAQPKKNAGGKPLARHWDEMWAEIAVRLWTGDLKPKSQADVKRAMLDWLSAHHIDAGDSTVVPRARRLWQNIQNAK